MSLSLSSCCCHNPWCSLSCRYTTPIPASAVTWGSPCVSSYPLHLCMSVPVSSSHKDTGHTGLEQLFLLIMSHSEVLSGCEFGRTLFNPVQLISCEAGIPLPQSLGSWPLWRLLYHIRMTISKGVIRYYTGHASTVMGEAGRWHLSGTLGWYSRRRELLSKAHRHTGRAAFGKTAWSGHSGTWQVVHGEESQEREGDGGHYG